MVGKGLYIILQEFDSWRWEGKETRKRGTGRTCMFFRFIPNTLNLAKKDGERKLRRGSSRMIRYSGTVFVLLQHIWNNANPVVLPKTKSPVPFDGVEPSLIGQMTVNKIRKCTYYICVHN